MTKSQKPKGLLSEALDLLPTGPKIIGVYAIHFPGNPKVYIGSSKDIRRRLRNHFLKLEAKKHPNYQLQAQHKFRVAHFIILNEYETVIEARDREQHILNTTPETRLFNIDKKVWGYTDDRR